MDIASWWQGLYSGLSARVLPRLELMKGKELGTGSCFYEYGGRR